MKLPAAETMRVSQYAAQHESIPFCVIKLTGIGSAKIMEKIQSGEKLTLHEQSGITTTCSVRLDKIVNACRQIME